MSPNLTRREFLEASAAAAAVSGLSQVAMGSESTSEEPVPFEFLLNGKTRRMTLEPRVTLLDLLRERLSLTGAKKGCNEGACGACSVLIDGKAINACLVLGVQCAGREVVTIEGISGPEGSLHPVQQAFIDHDALQCGHCTPGQVISAIGCIREGQATNEATVREWMSGNLCRCSAYPQITAAVLDAKQRMERA